MKMLGFRHHLAEQVIAGTKTVTWRLYDDKDLQVGDELSFIDSETKHIFAKAVIVSLREKKLGDVNDVDYVGHETFADNDEMIKTYREYYGDRVNRETMVKIIEFKLL